MTEENKFTPAAEGTIKVQNVTINNIMPNIPHKTAKSDTAYMVIYTDAFSPAPVTKMISNALFEGGAAQFNEELKTDLDNPEGWKPGEKATITSVMSKHDAEGRGYWGIKSIKKGHSLNPGKFAPGQSLDAPKSSGSGGNSRPYDASGPIKGKLENWAINLATTKATKTTGINDVLSTAAEYLENADAGLIKRITVAVDALYAKATAGTTTTPKEDKKDDKPAPAPQNNGAEDDLDDDIPF